MLTSVLVGSSYADAGATARDKRSDEPGVYMDITLNIVVAGLDSVVTAVPTPPDAPFVIT